MPSLNVTQKSAIVYFNTPEGVDLCGQEGTVVALTANPDIPEFIGTPLSAIPTQTQLLGVVLQGQPTREPASPPSSACTPADQGGSFRHAGHDQRRNAPHHHGQRSMEGRRQR
jgi:hypothetical protein